MKIVLVSRKGIQNRRFCSIGCARAVYNREHFRGENNPRWRGGRSLSYGPEWKKIKDFVRARDKVCRDCGKTTEENGRALDVHHTEPFRFSGRHDPEKLKALCRSCHMRAEDHGRRGSAKFVRGPVAPKPPTRRKIRKLKALARRAERDTRRRDNQLIAFHLHELGVSLRQIARDLEVSHQTVSNWLKGLYVRDQDDVA
jgi:5-methylcytosine-specific restriction endonuclease McrA